MAIGEFHRCRRNPPAAATPGVTLVDLKAALAQQGWTYRPDPTETSCFFGGSLATNASGARSFRWGSTRAHVRGLEVVLASGEVVELQRGEAAADAAGAL